MKLQKELNLNLKGEQIAEKYNQMQEEALNLRQEARIRINNLLKHKKAVEIVSKQNMDQKIDLGIEPNSGDPRRHKT